MTGPAKIASRPSSRRRWHRRDRDQVDGASARGRLLRAEVLAHHGGAAPINPLAGISSNPV